MAQSPVAEETIARPITLFIPPDRLNQEAEIIAQLMRGQRVDHFETVCVCRDGCQLEISLTISAVKDSNRFAQFGSTLRDKQRSKTREDSGRRGLKAI